MKKFIERKEELHKKALEILCTQEWYEHYFLSCTATRYIYLLESFIYEGLEFWRATGYSANSLLPEVGDLVWLYKDSPEHSLYIYLMRVITRRCISEKVDLRVIAYSLVEIDCMEVEAFKEHMGEIK